MVNHRLQAWFAAWRLLYWCGLAIAWAIVLVLSLPLMACWILFDPLEASLYADEVKQRINDFIQEGDRRERELGKLLEATKNDPPRSSRWRNYLKAVRVYNRAWTIKQLGNHEVIEGCAELMWQLGEAIERGDYELARLIYREYETRIEPRLAAHGTY